MKSITIHKIDDQTEKLLVERAKKEGISLNKLIKNLLRQSLGVEDKVINHKDDFQEYLGAWSKKDFNEFAENSSVFSDIHEKDWS